MNAAPQWQLATGPTTGVFQMAQTMLGSTSMRILLMVSCVLLGSVATVHAGGYVSLGVGSDASLHGEVSAGAESEDLQIGRLALGHRIGPWALEAAVFGTNLELDDTQMDTLRAQNESLAVGVGAKFHLGLVGPLEGYGRVGVHKTWISLAGSNTDMEYTGNGYDLGGGLQVSFRLIPVLHAALWLDYTRQVSTVSAGGAEAEATANMITAGITLGRGL